MRVVKLHAVCDSERPLRVRHTTLARAQTLQRTSLGMQHHVIGRHRARQTMT